MVPFDLRRRELPVFTASYFWRVIFAKAVRDFMVASHHNNNNLPSKPHQKRLDGAILTSVVPLDPRRRERQVFAAKYFLKTIFEKVSQDSVTAMVWWFFFVAAVAALWLSSAIGHFEQNVNTTRTDGRAKAPERSDLIG